MYKSFILAITISTYCENVIETNTRYERRCFKFTWLGPKYYNGTGFLNATCLSTAAGVPCEYPLIASYDGTWPNVEYIWTHHAGYATCVLSDSDVCAKYTYFFNGQAENSTYMCTRAIDSNNTVVPLGCYQVTNGSSSTRVCLCRSQPGGVPCNSANKHHCIKFLITAVFFLLFFVKGLFSKGEILSW